MLNLHADDTHNTAVMNVAGFEIFRAADSGIWMNLPVLLKKTVDQTHVRIYNVYNRWTHGVGLPIPGQGY